MTQPIFLPSFQPVLVHLRDAFYTPALRKLDPKSVYAQLELASLLGAVNGAKRCVVEYRSCFRDLEELGMEIVRGAERAQEE